MAICVFCDQEMTTGAGCVPLPIESGGQEVARKQHRRRSPCWDCGVHPGGYHHAGCDMERCPICGGQLVTCGCIEEDEPGQDHVNGHTEAVTP